VLDGVREVAFHQYYGNPPHWESFSSMYPSPFHEEMDVVKKSVIMCKSISLGQLLTKHGAPNLIHYLSVDTEYTDYEILEHFFTKELGERAIICLSVEHNFKEVREKLRTLLGTYRFTFYKELYQDDMYINNDFWNLPNL
jgi:hypothetical protein